MKNFVAYYRVSTAKQGASGLGLEAQEEAVKRIVDFKGGQIIASYREVESGANNDRPELAMAMKKAKDNGAIVIVAKLDRLARDARFLLTLADAGTPLLFGDFPDMDCTTPVGRMVLTQMAAVAEFERRRISERVSAALQAAKARGVKLGGYRGGHFPEDVREAGRLYKLELADKTALELFDIINELDPDRKLSRIKLAEQLNVHNVRTPSGKGKWVTTTVTRLLKRVEAIHERKRRTAAKSIRSVSDRLQKQPRTVCKRSLGGSA
jgi:DNA invertase Pin-like site-specific DNA recombinase